jgi:hypothetical protein
LALAHPTPRIKATASSSPRTSTWPDRSLVGAPTQAALSFLAQQAVRFPHLQTAWLHLLRGAVKAGQASAADLAGLEDRVRLSQLHLGQLYGTQLKQKSGVWRLEPVTEPATLDQRRHKMGLPPMQTVWNQLVQQDQLTDERLPEFVPPPESQNDLNP